MLQDVKLSIEIALKLNIRIQPLHDNWCVLCCPSRLRNLCNASTSQSCAKASLPIRFYTYRLQPAVHTCRVLLPPSTSHHAFCSSQADTGTVKRALCVTHPSLAVLVHECLVRKCAPIDRFASSAIPLGEVTALGHELRNDPVHPRACGEQLQLNSTALTAVYFSCLHHRAQPSLMGTSNNLLENAVLAFAL